MDLAALINKKIKELEETSNTPRLDCEILLSFVLKKPKEWLIANSDYKLTSRQQEKFDEFIKKRRSKVPIAYIIKQKSFYNLTFYINQDVLTPRPETELLVDNALKFLRGREQPRVIDVGTGSGCIPISIESNLSGNKGVEIWATDISKPALRIAHKNARKHSTPLKVRNTTLLKNIPRKFDLITANLPYLTAREAKKVSEKYQEPLKALDGGENGLTKIRKLLKQAENKLKKDGLILLEISPNQTRRLKEFIKNNLKEFKINFNKDLAGKNRIAQVEFRN